MSSDTGKKNLSDELVAASGGRPWKWDARFGAVLMEFGAGERDRMQATLRAHFSAVWDSNAIATAPAPAQALAVNYGGLRSGQLLFTVDLHAQDSLYGVWWPWGDGKTTSIRISMYCPGLPDAERESRIASLKARFGMKA